MSDKVIRQALNEGNHLNRGVEAGGQIRREWLKAARLRRQQLGVVEVKPKVIRVRAKKKEQRRKHLRSFLRGFSNVSTGSQTS